MYQMMLSSLTNIWIRPTYHANSDAKFRGKSEFAMKEAFQSLCAWVMFGVKGTLVNMKRNSAASIWRDVSDVFLWQNDSTTSKPIYTWTLSRSVDMPNIVKIRDVQQFWLLILVSEFLNFRSYFKVNMDRFGIALMFGRNFLDLMSKSWRWLISGDQMSTFHMYVHTHAAFNFKSRLLFYSCKRGIPY